MTTILHSIIPFRTINFSLSNSLSNSRKSSLNCSSIHPLKRRFQFGFWVTKSRFSLNSSFNEGDPNGSVEVLQVPDHWLEPAKALQVTLNSPSIQNFFVLQMFNCKNCPNFISCCKKKKLTCLIQYHSLSKLDSFL